MQFFCQIIRIRGLRLGDDKQLLTVARKFGKVSADGLFIFAPSIPVVRVPVGYPHFECLTKNQLIGNFEDPAQRQDGDIDTGLSKRTPGHYCLFSWFF